MNARWIFATLFAVSLLLGVRVLSGEVTLAAFTGSDSARGAVIAGRWATATPSATPVPTPVKITVPTKGTAVPR